MSETFNHGANRHIAGAEHDIDGFTKHRSSSRSSDLIIKNKDWQKTGLRLWLHMRAPIVSVWHHQFFKIIEKKDDKEKLPIFYKWNCWEEEPVNVARFKRARNGSRVVPPKACPFCKFSEEIRLLVQERKIGWTDEILKFEGDNRAETKIIRAGDFWGAFSSRDLDDAEVADIRRAGMIVKDAWKTSLVAKCEYIFVGVDHDAAAEGCKIVIPTGVVGEKMQDAIMREQKRTNKDKGNPLKNPYLFEWTYDDRERDNKKKYKVEVLGEPVTDAILAVIRDTDPPDTSDETAWGDADELRTLIERHAVVDLRLIMPALDRSFPARDDSSKGGPAPAREGPKDAPAAAGAPDTGTSKATMLQAVADAAKPPAPPTPEELFDCEHCGAKEVMKATDFDCPKCGAKYVEVGEGVAKSTVLGYRPCLSCKTPVALPGVVGPGKGGDKVKCGQCDAEHFENGEDPPAWVMVDPPKPEAPAPTRRRR